MSRRSHSSRPAPLADVWSGAWTLALAACGAFALVDAWAPPQDLPWKPLDLRLPVGAATAAKIRALDLPSSATPAEVEAGTARCMALLRQAGVSVARATDRDDGAFCVVQGAVRLTGGDLTPLSPSGAAMRCPLAARLLLWDREVVRPAAREVMGAEAVRIDSLGTYACRRVYGSADAAARPSQHARANALDVAGVGFSDGRRATLAADWDGQGPSGAAGAAFLRRLRDGGCRLFGNVLTPDYNAAHRDHFHLDASAWGVCAQARN
ncbi:MAG: extensin family protein [Bordetella sp.]|nr:extensin family protein [Bordetella sp.]